MRHLFLFLLLCLERADRQLHVASGHYNFSPAPTHGVYPAYILAPSRQLLTSRYVPFYLISERLKRNNVVYYFNLLQCQRLLIIIYPKFPISLLIGLALWRPESSPLAANGVVAPELQQEQDLM